MSNSKRSLAVAALFFLSGASGLAFEIVWTRALGPWMGASASTTAIVIGLFMGGLAAGSALAPRLRCDPLRGYGLAELGSGLWGLATPALLAALEPAFRTAFELSEGMPLLAGSIRMVCAAAIVLPPTLMMGLSFPLLARHSAGSAAWLYAVNTCGAVAGAAAAGLLLLPSVGLAATRVTASSVNLLVGAVACALALGDSAAFGGVTSARPAGCGKPAPASRILLALSLLWGAATMVVELAAERSLALSLGSSVYSLTLVLVLFIAGLALGGALFARLRPADGWAGLAVMATLAGLATAVAVPLLGDLPVRMVPLVAQFSRFSFLALLAVQCALVAVLLLPATFLMGAGMPMACRLAGDAANIGPLYAANTLGAIAGSLGAGLVTIPVLGLRNSLLVGAAVFLLVGAAAARQASTRRARCMVQGLALAGLAALALVPAWQAAVISSGPFLYANVYEGAAAKSGRAMGELLSGFDRVLYHREGALATVTVRESPQGNRSLAINGKVDASSRLDLGTQLLVGHLPLAFGPARPKVLIVGLGSGVTAGAVLTHDVASVDCLELCPEVVEAARFFDEANGRALDDPRLNVKVTDARAFMRLANQSYEAIVCEPSNPWVSGMAGMFTKEHFEACRSRLAPNGVICQWLQAYSLSPADFRSVVRTFREVFPGATLWEAWEGVDYMLVARADGRRLALGTAIEAMKRPAVSASLARAEVKRPADLASRLVLDAASLERFVEGSPVQVEDLPRLEFTAPLFLYRDTGTPLLAELEPVRAASGFGLAATGPGELAQLERSRSVGQLVRQAKDCASRGELDAADRSLTEASQLDPGSGQVVPVWAPILLESGCRARTGGELAAAARYFERYLQLTPEDLGVWNDLGVQYGRLGERDRATAAYKQALARDPGYQPAMKNLAVLAYEAGNLAEACGLYERLTAAGSPDGRLLNNLGICYMKLEKYPQALRAWRKALAAEPGMARVQENIRIVEFLGYRE